MWWHSGCTYQIVNNGQQAVEEVTASMLNEGAVMYDVIFMDCMMVHLLLHHATTRYLIPDMLRLFAQPLMDGYEATRCIRQVEAQTRKPRNKILALTANVLPDEQKKCIDAGMVNALFTSRCRPLTD